MTLTKPRRISLTSQGRRLTLEFIWFAGSTAAFQGSRILTGLIAAGTLVPAAYAAWGIALAILAYSVYFNFGIASGVNRELPRAIGAGDTRGAQRIEDAGSAGTIVASAFSLLAAGAIAALASLDGLVLVLVAGAAAAQQYYLYAQTRLRSRLRFNTASLQQTVLAVAFPLVAIPLLPAAGVAALLVAQVASFLIGAAFAGRWRPGLTMETRAEMRRLVHIGSPIMIAGLLFAVLTTLDRWAVLALLGDEATGLYTLAALLSSSALLVAVVVAQQFYPRMAHALGRGEPTSRVFVMAVRQAVLSSALVAPLSLALALGAPPLVGAMLPEYAASAPALQILSIGFVPLVAASGFSNFLVVIGRTSLYLAALIGAACVEVVLAIVLQDIGLAGIAAAASAGYSVLLIATSVMAVASGRR